MKTICRIEFEEFGLGQIFHGLEVHAAASKKTDDGHRMGESPQDFIVEKSSSANESDSMDKPYPSILAQAWKRREAQL